MEPEQYLNLLNIFLNGYLNLLNIPNDISVVLGWEGFLGMDLGSLMNFKVWVFSLGLLTHF